MENKYTKLPIPDESAWSRKDWRYYSPIWLNKLIDSLENLIDWLPTIWKDRHWDDYYITKLLQRKIELQRKYIVSNNRHLSVPSDNYWMTVLLNLLEREHESYYELEQYDYHKLDFFIEDSHLMKKLEHLKNNSDYLDDYINKYPLIVKKVKVKFPRIDFSDKRNLALYIGIYNQIRCRDLIFNILKHKSQNWWD